MLEQAERNIHLKETLTKSQNSKHVYFFYKQDTTKINKIISAKDFLPYAKHRLEKVAHSGLITPKYRLFACNQY